MKAEKKSSRKENYHVSQMIIEGGKRAARKSLTGFHAHDLPGGFGKADLVDKSWIKKE